MGEKQLIQLRLIQTPCCKTVPSHTPGSNWVTSKHSIYRMNWAKTREIIKQWLYILLDVWRNPLTWEAVSRTRTGCECAAWSTCHFARSLVFACVAAKTVRCS